MTKTREHLARAGKEKTDIHQASFYILMHILRIITDPAHSISHIMVKVCSKGFTKIFRLNFRDHSNFIRSAVFDKKKRVMAPRLHRFSLPPKWCRCHALSYGKSNKVETSATNDFLVTL